MKGFTFERVILAPLELFVVVFVEDFCAEDARLVSVFTGLLMSFRLGSEAKR